MAQSQVLENSIGERGGGDHDQGVYGSMWFIGEPKRPIKTCIEQKTKYFSQNYSVDELQREILRAVGIWENYILEKKLLNHEVIPYLAGISKGENPTQEELDALSFSFKIQFLKDCNSGYDLRIIFGTTNEFDELHPKQKGVERSAYVIRETYSNWSRGTMVIEDPKEFAFPSIPNSKEPGKPTSFLLDWRNVPNALLAALLHEFGHIYGIPPDTHIEGTIMAEDLPNYIFRPHRERAFQNHRRSLATKNDLNHIEHLEQLPQLSTSFENPALTRIEDTREIFLCAMCMYERIEGRLGQTAKRGRELFRALTGKEADGPIESSVTIIRRSDDISRQFEQSFHFHIRSGGVEKNFLLYGKSGAPLSEAKQVLVFKRYNHDRNHYLPAVNASHIYTGDLTPEATPSKSYPIQFVRNGAGRSRFTVISSETNEVIFRAHHSLMDM